MTSNTGVNIKRFANGIARLVFGLCVVLTAPAWALGDAPTSAAKPTEKHEPLAPINYDPTKCSTNAHGLIYFAVGRRVYRQPESTMSGLVAYTKKMKEDQHIPEPPNPNDPLGCPDHPIQVLNNIMRRIVMLPDDKGTPLSTKADLIAGIQVVNNPNEGLTNDGTFERFCKDNGISQDVAKPGFTGCRTKGTECYSIAYQAIDYIAPNGKKLSMWCRPAGRCENGPTLCDVAYKLYPDLNIGYTFYSTELPIEDIIDVNKEILRRIEAAEVKNYAWPDAKPAIPAGR